MISNLIGLGRVAVACGDPTRAAAPLQEALELARRMQPKPDIVATLHVLEWAASLASDAARAVGLWRESLALWRAMVARPGITECLEGLATVAAGTGAHERATRLLGSAEALREAMGALLPLIDRPEHEATVGSARSVLGEATFAATWAASRALTLEEAVAEALAGEPIGARS